ncbi:hypothetical protein [Paenarthrobacter histidinolovorans]|uniref:DUF222 domain-containing protein n=1 Tax=Paenarthrobacter histidinolovorans TaxID=43664 RepID=A0ABW8N0I5_9MICC
MDSTEKTTQSYLDHFNFGIQGRSPEANELRLRAAAGHLQQPTNGPAGEASRAAAALVVEHQGDVYAAVIAPRFNNVLAQVAAAAHEPMTEAGIADTAALMLEQVEDEILVGTWEPTPPADWAVEQEAAEARQTASETMNTRTYLDGFKLGVEGHTPEANETRRQAAETRLDEIESLTDAEYAAADLKELQSVRLVAHHGGDLAKVLEDETFPPALADWMRFSPWPRDEDEVLEVIDGSRAQLTKELRDTAVPGPEPEAPALDSELEELRSLMQAAFPTRAVDVVQTPQENTIIAVASPRQDVEANRSPGRGL